MSIVIYDGLLLAGDPNDPIGTMNSAYEDVRTFLKKRTISYIRRMVASSYQYMMDCSDIGLELPKRYKDYIGLTDRFHAEKSDEHRMFLAAKGFVFRDKGIEYFVPVKDMFSCDMIFYPIQNKKILALVSSNCGDIHNFMRDIESNKIVKYGYWDNTDQPDDVSDEEWSVRCDDWHAAIPHSPIVSDVAFSRRILSEIDVSMLYHGELLRFEDFKTKDADWPNMDSRINSVKYQYVRSVLRGDSESADPITAEELEEAEKPISVYIANADDVRERKANVLKHT